MDQPGTATQLEADDSAQQETTVTVRCTGHVRMAVGAHELEYTFTGTTLRAFLEAFFDEYDVEELLIAETEAEATARGWAPVPDELPGTWRKNPEGDQTRPYAGSVSTAGSTNTTTASKPNSSTETVSRSSIRSCFACDLPPSTSGDSTADSTSTPRRFAL